jgi:hypothetical protein
MFAITVQTMVGYQRKDSNVDIKNLAAGEDGSLKLTLDLHEDDDGRCIVSGLDAFKSYFAAV